MRFEKIRPDSVGSGITRAQLVTGKNHYINDEGRITHHRRMSNTSVKFVGVDGEGMTVNGEHRYVLFGVGEDQIEDPKGLSFERIFSHLYEHYRPNTAYVGFYLGYDFSQIIKTMTEDKAWMLLTKEGQALRKHRIPGKPPHPVELNGWQFDLLGMKRLRIRPKECSCPYPTCKCKHSPWMYVCDVGSFFQAAFLKVIDPGGWANGTAVVSDAEYETIREGKELRSTAILDENMRGYNRLENVVLSRVMETLDGGFHSIGIHLPASKWFGPGQAAQTWLRNIGMATRAQVSGSVPSWFLEAARMSYYGGWFEIMMHGIVEGITHEYDINSAYPSIIAELPCLLHGTYTHGTGLPSVDSRERCLVFARVWSPGMPNSTHKQHIGAVLHRDDDGRILRPCASEGWFWWHELKAAEKAGLVKRLDNRGYQKVLKWVKYTPCDCPPPMASIRELYARRLEVGKTTSLGKAAKLVYNSAYGKFAQSVGEPLFSNPVYASLITAGCRTQILEAIATHPLGRADVAMVATDAVYFLSPHPGLSISEKLGEWDHTQRTNLTLFKPGVYWDDAARERIALGQSANFKARGINVSDFARSISGIDTTFRAWENDTTYPWPKVVFPTSFSLVTALQALRRHDWSLAGAVRTGVNVIQDSNPEDKRHNLYRDSYNGRTVYRSEPYPGLVWGNDLTMEWVRSTPYEHRFGMEDPWSDEYREQFGHTEDGNIVDMLAWVLRED